MSNGNIKHCFEGLHRQNCVHNRHVTQKLQDLYPAGFQKLASLMSLEYSPEVPMKQRSPNPDHEMKDVSRILQTSYWIPISHKTISDNLYCFTNRILLKISTILSFLSLLERLFDHWESAIGKVISPLKAYRLRAPLPLSVQQWFVKQQVHVENFHKLPG